MRITVLAPGGSADAVSLEEFGDVAVVGLEGAEVTLPVRAPNARSQRIAAALSRTFPTRALLRVLPWEPSTWFARAIAADPRARAALTEADVVVAADPDAVYAAWRIARPSARVRSVVFGFPAARAACEDLS